MSISLKGRILAIAAGVAFTAGGLTILLGDVIAHRQEWNSYHALTILTVFGTIAAGHLMVDAGRAKHYLSALGFFVLFMSGTGLVVYQSVGRQAETTDAKVLDAEASNQLIASKGADLAKARSRFDDANRMADNEMRGERCGPRCKDWRQRATEVQALISQIEGEIRALGPQKPVAPKAEKMAAVAALFGADEQKAKASLMLLEPFLWTLFFEIGSIVSLGFAFRSGKPNSAMAKPNSVSDSPNSGGVLDTIGPDKSGPSDSPTVRTEKQKALSEVLAMLADGQTIPSQDYLADHWNRPKQTVSDWMRDWRRIGVIPSETKTGRCKATVPA